MDYIIEFKPVIIEYNYDEIKLIEDKIKNKVSISNNEITMLLDSLCYTSRFKVNKNLDNFDYKCDLFQSILCYYFRNLGCEVNPCMTQNVITNDVVGHSFLIVKVLVNDFDQYFLIDPSYIQFFTKEKCQGNKYVVNVQPPHQILMTPDPGYFITEEQLDFAKFLCNHGYILLNDDTAQMYGDSFFNTKVGRQGVTYQTIPGAIYIKAFLKGNESLSKSEGELEELGFSTLFNEDSFKKTGK